MTDDLAARMRPARVEDLMLMARGRPEDGIAPEAVTAAQAELAARDLPVEEIEELASDLDARQQEDDSRATRRLSTPGRIFFGIFGFTLFGLIGVFILHARGRRQAASDALVATLIGLALIWGLAIASLLLSDLAGT